MLNFLNKLLKSISNKFFSLISVYSNCITDSLEKLNFRNFISYVKSHISDFNYIFHWDKLRESHKKEVKKSTIKYVSIKSNNSYNAKSAQLNALSTEDYLYTYFNNFVKNYFSLFLDNFKRTFSFGFYYLRGLFFILFIDACLTDDEPL